MSEIICKHIACDRCGTTINLKKIGTKELDGGYTVYDKFEDKPEGWTKECGKDLCPLCAEYLKEIIDSFWKDLI